ncbi:MAG: hypothetical protein MZV70_61260 [Desulfobacterales bacterium]|nr:hypothetical protein [Desulfobacterales bacterium]
MTLVAVAAALGALWLTNGAVTPKEATWDDVLAEAKSGGYRIITTRGARCRAIRRIPMSSFWWTLARSGSTAPGTSRAPSTFRWSRPGGRAGARRTRCKTCSVLTRTERSFSTERA